MGDQPRNDLAAIQRRKLALYGWMLMAPSLALLSLFAFYPAIATFFGSLFTRGTTRRPSSFAGFENYLDLFADPTFWTVAGNNLIYAGVTIPVSIIFALIMALWANAHIPARSFVRSAYFTPTILPMIAAANLWLFFYTPDLGIIDRITGFFGAEPTNWLGQPETALAAVIIVTIWKEAGFFMIFYLAALQTIPPDLREAASIEGAGRWTYTRRVLLPLLMPTTIFVFVNALINSIKLIDHLFILTKGGPNNASKLILYWIWEMAFAYFDRPHAAAMTMMVLLVLGIVAIVQFRLVEKRTHYR
ncbi:MULTISPECIES: sugar ABC transporter permease [Thalassospira]|jgi:sn-glycerol 3-phosphate transport system permease protein|uniref:carbohydrate ABC transporter permease n=1 Tax=Thalassospira TaxID=168934 RepID=UPI0008DDF14B|nr:MULTISPECIES: sugar ABC transporter permease [Thalassospira]MAB34412.1 sugar ABC transporter permease [Thalassospira sp.]MDM7977411.1 sugar ABC transporter permease [Thalassospira xiamenensis]OHY98091.1 ABC transporter permease [Thalassospira sp. MIT1004]HBS22942.1 sugar ABC transporter permease [Thalassospira sp.]|tara:strand:+ start:1738 stop:2646 length:909 start_codon:yes stop_codon:yes gene_type:complete